MPTQDIATIGRGVAAARPEFTDEQVSLIKRTVAAGTTNDELKLFLYQCQRTGLDPLAKQIYCIVRGQGERRKATIQTAIDGYRLIADRTGIYCGNDDAVFEIENNRPVAATVTVWKLVGGIRCPFTASARFNEYRPEKYGNNTRPDMWDKMPFVMLGKVAEALALRKAFPADLSGVYTQEEMAQAIPPGSHEEAAAGPEPTSVRPSENQPPPTPEQEAQREYRETSPGAYVCDAVHDDGVRQCINTKPHNKAHVWEEVKGRRAGS